jgi:hypothetical protein
MLTYDSSAGQREPCTPLSSLAVTVTITTGKNQSTKYIFQIRLSELVNIITININIINIIAVTPYFLILTQVILHG